MVIYTHNNPMFFRTLFISLCFLSSDLPAEDTLHIFAAASLSQPLEELSKQFTQENDHKISLTFAASSTLARQIVQGAPAALYISANSDWIDYLQDYGSLSTASRQQILTNTLVVASHNESDIEPFIFSKTMKFPVLDSTQARIAVGNPDHVPSGMYAKEALTHVNQWSTWQPYLAPANNARSALALTERQETIFGIHYRSDVINSETLKILSEIPKQFHSPIKYEIVLIGENVTSMALRYAQFLTSPNSLNLFTAYGFSLPEGDL